MRGSAVRQATIVSPRSCRRCCSFDIFGVHEFNSTRKRMAVVARDPTGRYLLLVKVRRQRQGCLLPPHPLATALLSPLLVPPPSSLLPQGADNVIFDRAIAEPERPQLEAQLALFASTGLRTLVLAQRELSAAEFEAWRRDYDAASVALDRRDDKLAEVSPSLAL